MSKLIVQGLLSLFVSLGVIVGATPDVRGEVKQVWHETKAIAREAVDYVSHTAMNLTPEIGVDASVETNADANAAADSQTEVGEASSDVQVESQIDAQVGGSLETESEDGVLLNLDGDAGVELDLGLGLGE